jgi:sugar lactone lactonase YvrE
MSSVDAPDEICWATTSEETRMPDALSTVLETTTAERLATGFVFTEGPLWHPEGFYYFVDIRRSRLYRIVPGKPAELLREQTGETARRSTCRVGSSSARVAIAASPAGRPTGAARS